MPEPLSNQSGAEQELPQYIECLLSVSGDAAFLNTLTRLFGADAAHSGPTAPQTPSPGIRSTRCFRCRRRSSAAAFSRPDACGARVIGKPAETCVKCRSNGYWENGATVSSYGTRSPKYVSRCLPALSNPEVLLDRAYQGRQFRTMGQRIDPARVHDRKWAVHGKLPPE